MIPYDAFLDKLRSWLDQRALEKRKRHFLANGRIPHSLGYNDYKMQQIRQTLCDDLICQFRLNKLPQGHGSRLDERLVEYPWLVSRIKEHEHVVMDAGSALNFKEILSSRQFRGKKVYIDTLYYEGHPDVIPSPSYVYEDLREVCFKSDFFDAIYSLSTIEHIGLDNTLLYTPDQSYREQCKYSYVKAIEEFRRVLKPGGTLYVTVPYGAYCNHNWFQVFDAEMVERLIESFAPCFVEKTYYRYANDQWNISTEALCADGDYYDPHRGDSMPADALAAARCVVCLEMNKPVRAAHEV